MTLPFFLTRTFSLEKCVRYTKGDPEMNFKMGSKRPFRGCQDSPHIVGIFSCLAPIFIEWHSFFYATRKMRGKRGIDQRPSKGFTVFTLCHQLEYEIFMTWRFEGKKRFIVNYYQNLKRWKVFDFWDFSPTALHQIVNFKVSLDETSSAHCGILANFIQ